MKKKLKSDFAAHWKARIGDQNIEKKLNLYAKVKQGLLVDKYLEMPSFRNRQIISKFLCSNHRLRIETGRHIDSLREERLCKLCEMSKVEDESHFILECPTYDSIRTESPINFENHSSVETLFHLEEPQILAEFLRKACDKRDQLTEEEPDIYKVIEKSKSGMQITLHRGKDTPGRLKVKNLTKDGLKLKIYRTSITTPFGTQSD